MAMFLISSESQPALGSKSSSSSSSGFFFDCFGTITGLQVLAMIEYWYHGAEAVFWFSLVLPIGGAYLAYTSYSGSTLSRLMGGRSGDTEEVDPILQAKRDRRQEHKMKRASVGQRK
eukprot:CAMPEP_0114348374 /NCGR_PEP_ID=MMETSP0101-20121206/14649_1 /TAXON_ID=38822 ORGANISM="Pteridomonas danica, Strain PT" /NCGR_SAMPLE_ID=MMETSP0101 /ASSEMBLY_ACC=CAM_ASM_000211 /LENGTH=116 /DNA_ID=CAMNT_0001486245 /DNA_START=131 /DNA_END=481 /DNA_ORIENTATION=-